MVRSVRLKEGGQADKRYESREPSAIIKVKKRSDGPFSFFVRTDRASQADGRESSESSRISRTAAGLPVTSTHAGHLLALHSHRTDRGGNGSHRAFVRSDTEELWIHVATASRLKNHVEPREREKH